MNNISIINLPNPLIIYEVLPRLPLKDILAFGATCKKFCIISKSDCLWKNYFKHFKKISRSPYLVKVSKNFHYYCMYELNNLLKETNDYSNERNLNKNRIKFYKELINKKNINQSNITPFGQITKMIKNIYYIFLIKNSLLFDYPAFKENKLYHKLPSINFNKQEEKYLNKCKKKYADLKWVNEVIDRSMIGNNFKINISKYALSFSKNQLKNMSTKELKELHEFHLMRDWKLF